MKVDRFKSLNDAAHVASIILIMFFFVSLIFTVLPNLPRYPTDPESWGWYIITWNLPGPLMFITVFRIHALRVIGERIQGKKVMGITMWVKFWFIVAISFGLLTLPFLANTYLLGGATMSWYMAVGTIMVVIAWFVLLFSTLSLLWVGCSKTMLAEVERARKINRVLLAPTSIVFLFFTGLSSVTILLL
ncbi:MAG: hypothetical protein QMD95_02840 [Candidatus Hodarchaeaceae archaeon]|nr:hypothetical protein [Candidatus Hodarchaeaceae archaeon]